MTKLKPVLPATGGSFVRKPDGSLEPAPAKAAPSAGKSSDTPKPTGATAPVKEA